MDLQYTYLQCHIDSLSTVGLIEDNHTVNLAETQLGPLQIFGGKVKLTMLWLSQAEAGLIQRESPE